MDWMVEDEIVSNRYENNIDVSCILKDVKTDFLDIFDKEVEEGWGLELYRSIGRKQQKYRQETMETLYLHPSFWGSISTTDIY